MDAAEAQQIIEEEVEFALVDLSSMPNLGRKANGHASDADQTGDDVH